MTYTRWGKSSCPNDTGAELVYSGLLGGTNWNVRGGSAEKLCLPDDPEYLNETAGVTIPYYSIVQGSEYEFWAGQSEMSPITKCHVLCVMSPLGLHLSWFPPN